MCPCIDLRCVRYAAGSHPPASAPASSIPGSRGVCLLRSTCVAHATLMLLPRLAAIFQLTRTVRRQPAAALPARPQGQYFRRKEAISVLGFIAPLLEETPASLAAYAPKPGTAEAAATAAAGPQAPQQNGAAAAAAVAAAEQQDGDEAAEAEQSSREPSPAAATGPIGPQMGPQAGPGLQADGREGLVESEGEEDSGGEEPGGGGEAAAAEAAAPKRALGPAMPTQQQLEFAAQVCVCVCVSVLGTCMRCVRSGEGWGLFLLVGTVAPLRQPCPLGMSAFPFALDRP